MVNGVDLVGFFLTFSGGIIIGALGILAILVGGDDSDE